MNADSKDFLKLLVETPSPSGYEHDVQKLVRQRIKPWCDEVRTDVMGNVFGIRNLSGKPRIMLAGHCDQIGFLVNHITDEGFLHLDPIGGVDPVVATSQRVSIMTRKGLVPGVIGRKAIHLMDDEDKKRVPKIHDLYIDIGANSKKDALKLVTIGDAGIFVQPYVDLANDRAVSMAFDNKMGTWIVTETLRLLHKRAFDGCVIGVSTVQEEIGLRGATASAFSSEADVGIALDVAHGTDTPGIEKKRAGDFHVGKGPMIYRGANINPHVFDLLVAAAEKEKIPYQVASAARGTGTDANVMQLSRGGMATGLLSTPLRYMHTPNELLSLEDLENTARLLAAFCVRLKKNQDFTP
ncbi:MAG TPA: M42 family metallopeptidase [Chthoniobacterales bacterium]|nr:M42 family metallopeptidase [Chthoniobacterales bacterium]